MVRICLKTKTIPKSLLSCTERTVLIFFVSVTFYLLLCLEMLLEGEGNEIISANSQVHMQKWPHGERVGLAFHGLTDMLSRKTTAFRAQVTTH